MNVQNAIFNWLQIKIVADARPDDQAALETVRFFETILHEDHGLSNVTIDQSEDESIHVHYVDKDGQAGQQSYDYEVAAKLLGDINSNPKYN